MQPIVVTPDRTTSVVTVAGHPVIHGVMRVACDALGSASIVGEATTLEAARDILDGSSPDLLVIDLELPDGDGLELLATMAGEDDAPRIAVLSDRRDGLTVLTAMQLGAVAYVTKSDGLRKLADVLRQVTDGDVVVSDELERSAVSALGRFARQARERSGVERRLSVRERDVLCLMAEGLTIRQIARRLTLSPRTVETHVSKLYRKLGVRSRLQAVSRGMSLGLISLE